MDEDALDDTVEKWLGETLWTCRKTDYRMNE